MLVCSAVQWFSTCVCYQLWHDCHTPGCKAWGQRKGGRGGGQVLHAAACMHALAMTSAAEIAATVITVVATVITVDVTSWYFTWFRLQGEGVQTRSD